jgi:hypothetical protein
VILSETWLLSVKCVFSKTDDLFAESSTSVELYPDLEATDSGVFYLSVGEWCTFESFCRTLIFM